MMFKQMHTQFCKYMCIHISFAQDYKFKTVDGSSGYKKT